MQRPTLDIERVTRSLQVCLDQLRIVIDAVSDVQWSPSRGYLFLVYRSVLRRQHDAVGCIVDLVRRNQGLIAVGLLRPACEELIWIRYLVKIDPELAEEIVSNKLVRELHESLAVQHESNAKLGIADYGLPQPDERRATEAEQALQHIGRKLGWPLRSNQCLPSVRFLAEKSNSLELYKFLYNATSRSVHFTVSNYLRMVWGDSGSFSIRSNNFADYWHAFALYWGYSLLRDTYIELEEHVGIPELVMDESTAQAFQSAQEDVLAIGPVPLITSAELKWR